MKYKLTQNERRILLDIARSNKERLHIFTIYTRHRLTPFDLSKLIYKLDKLKLVKLEEEYVKLTELGFDWVIKSRLDFDVYQIKPWRQCPDEFKENAIAINSFYTPLQSYVSNSLFKRSIHGQREDG